MKFKSKIKNENTCLYLQNKLVNNFRIADNRRSIVNIKCIPLNLQHSFMWKSISLLITIYSNFQYI